MSIVLEQTRQEVSDALALAAKAVLSSVKVLSANYSRELSLHVDSPVQVQVKYTPNTIQVNARNLLVDIGFSCRIVPAGDIETELAIVQVEVGLQATYLLEDEFLPTEEQKVAFHNGNAVFNCWPFFREFVLSAASRMEVPPPPIPFLTVHVKSQSQPQVALPDATNMKRTKRVSSKPKAR